MRLDCLALIETVVTPVTTKFVALPKKTIYNHGVNSTSLLAYSIFGVVQEI